MAEKSWIVPDPLNPDQQHWFNHYFVSDAGGGEE